jgi:NAD(P)-dependent dehydrogenase (short-subunit alcohol dehydrogenase family)
MPKIRVNAIAPGFFPASDASHFFTGVTISVDGGIQVFGGV